VSGQRVHAATRVDFLHQSRGIASALGTGADAVHRTAKALVQLVDAHALVGMRTANIDGAHVEYFRGIANPIGVKVGGSMSAEWLQELIQVLNPQNLPGRLTLIHRFGIKEIEQRLPDMIRAVRATGSQVLWVCDPMHGNTETTAGGIKTRRFDNILGEVEAAFRIHGEEGSMLGGVHIELTGEDVTECVGGARGLTENDLARAYRSQVDPRLNAEQALELAMLIARPREHDIGWARFPGRRPEDDDRRFPEGTPGREDFAAPSDLAVRDSALAAVWLN